MTSFEKIREMEYRHLQGNYMEKMESSIVMLNKLVGQQEKDIVRLHRIIDNVHDIIDKEWINMSPSNEYAPILRKILEKVT